MQNILEAYFMVGWEDNISMIICKTFYLRRYLKDSNEMMYLKILKNIKFYKIYSTVLLNKSGIFF